MLPQQNLVGGLKRVFYFPIYIYTHIYTYIYIHIYMYIWDNPSHWLSYFSRGLKPPTRNHWFAVRLRCRDSFSQSDCAWLQSAPMGWGIDQLWWTKLTMWGPQTIVTLVQITPITMVYGTYLPNRRNHEKYEATTLVTECTRFIRLLLRVLLDVPRSWGALPTLTS